MTASITPKAPGHRKDPGANPLILSGSEFLTLARQLRATGKHIRSWKIIGTSQYEVKPRNILPILDRRPGPSRQMTLDFGPKTQDFLNPGCARSRAGFAKLRSVLS